jgi:small subunit ribosomal protein S5
MSRRKEKFAEKPKKEFDEVMLEVRRVTRVTTGGRQLSFRAIILVGNRKGKIWIGISKGADVQIAVSKATRDAYKNVVDVPLTEKWTIPYEVANKYKGSQVKLIPAAPGTGLKAGSSVRMVLDLVGCTNILSKIMGSPNKLNNALATVQALGTFKMGKFPERIKKNKGDDISEETTDGVVSKNVIEDKKTESKVKTPTVSKKSTVEKKTEDKESAKKPASKKAAPKKVTPKKDT